MKKATETQKAAAAAARAASKDNKNEIRNYFGGYDSILRALWSGFKNERAAFKAVNNAVSGIAGSEGYTVPEFLIVKFSRIVTPDGRPVIKSDKGYKLRTLNGQSARTILRDAALNAIESQRPGNRFSQKIVEVNAE